MKFTNFKNKELSVFKSKRLVYMANAEELTNTATKEMAEAAEKVESQVKLDKMDPYKAMKEAKEKIFVTWQLASERVAPTPSMKYKADIIKLLDRLNTAKKEANKKLDDNLNHYVEVAAFIKKRTELELLLEGNKTSMGGVEANMLFIGVEALDSAITAFEAEAKTLGAMPDVGLEEDKKSLIEKVQAQKKDMEKLKKKLIDYHKEKISMHDETLEAIKKHFEPNYMGPSVISERTVRDLYAHLYYLDGLRVNSAGGLEIAGLTQDVEKHCKDFEETIARAEKSTPMDSTLKEDHKPFWERYKLSRDNYMRAQENYNRVSSNPKSTQAEKRKAESWLAGAQQTASKQLDDLKQKYVEFREGEGNMKAFDRDKQSVERGADRNETFASATIKQMKEAWDKYEQLNAQVLAAQAEVEATAPKGKASKANQEAQVKLFQAKKKFSEHEQKIRKEYAGMGPDDVTQDLYEEKFYDGTLRIGTTTVEHYRPQKPEAPEEKPEPPPEKKPMPADFPVAAAKKPGPTKKA
ncbi:hypothetical protein IT413_03910 [Candidatus Peregrinibacteria bacterium]|nr:hypothetical protein [Candidatus Peregrinibacteria bacterium]